MRLRTLGGLALPGVSFRRHKPLLLLTFLAVEGPKDRRYLAELLWPGAANPRQSLSVALSQLRQEAPEAVGVDEARLWANVECDAVLLREAAAARDWRAAADLYAGPFLAGVDIDDGNVELEEWLFFTREMLAAEAQRALIEVAEGRLAAGDSRAAAGLAERAMLLQPDVVDSDADLLSRLHALLVGSDNPRAAALRREASAIGVSISERAVVGGRVEPRPALHNLPRTARPLVGRERELRDLQTRLEDGERLLTISGLGGIGKTRLSVALAARLLERAVFDSVYYVPLEAVADPGEVLGRIAMALGLPLGGGGPLSALRERLAAGRSLLVLDNFEHVTAGAPQLVALLEACPKTQLVITSREPLGVAAESLYPLGGLPLPASVDEALAGGTRDDAVSLYLLSSRRFDPRFGLDESNVAAVLGVCRLLDGVPLGIELAAALARVIPLAELERELEADLDTLIATQPDVPEQHESMRAVFERSWGLLDEVARLGLAGSSVFQGGFTRKAASFVLGMDMRLLSALLDRSLLRREGPRYDLHPLVKQYAGEKLISLPAAEQVRARHAEFFCRLLESKRPFYMQVGQRAAFEELDRDFANLRAAWVWAVETRRHDVLERMVPMLKDYMVMRERSGALASLMDAAWPTVDPESLLGGRILFAQARVLAGTGAAEALPLYERALVLARKHEDEGDAARILMDLGTVHFNQLDLESARGFWLEALPLLERHGSAQQLGGCLSNLGLLAADRAEHERLQVEAIAACRRSGNAAHLAAVLRNYAVFVSTTYGDYARAYELTAEAIALERDEVGRKYHLAKLHTYAGFNLVQLGDLAGAERHLAAVSLLFEGRESSDESSVRGGRRTKQFLLAQLHYARGDVELARAEAADSLDERDGCELLAWIALYDGDAGEAERFRQTLLARHAVKPEAPRYVEYDYALSHLLSAGVAALPRAAGDELLAALRVITEFAFVPLAFDAFVIAYAVAPAVAGEALLALAATHPAAEYRTRRRATQLMGPSAVQGVAWPADDHARRRAVPLAPDAVLELARQLADRLVAARGSTRPSETA